MYTKDNMIVFETGEELVNTIGVENSLKMCENLVEEEPALMEAVYNDLISQNTEDSLIGAKIVLDMINKKRNLH